MKLLPLVAVAFVGGILLLVTTEPKRHNVVPSDPDVSARATATATAEPVRSPPKLVASSGEGRIAVVEPETLKRTAPRILTRDVGDGVLSPDGRRAAFPHHYPGENSVRVLDVERNRLSERIRLGRGDGNAHHLTWIDSRRFVAFSSWIADRATMIELDAVTGKVLSRRRTRSSVIATARSSLGVVALLAPAGRIGIPKLVAGDRSFDLRLMRAGSDRSGERSRHLIPGLAVDPETDMAYVVDAEFDRIDTVDLRNEIGRGPLKLDPVARAGKEIDSRRREAAWLGDGKLVVTGSHDHPDGRIEPYGLRLVDVETLEQTMLAPEQSILAAGGGRAVAWDPGGRGLTVFWHDGRKRHQLLGGNRVSHVQVLGDYAYAHTFARKGRPGPTAVVDLRDGSQVASVRSPDLRVTASSAQPATETLLGIAYRRGGQGRLAAYDPVTLRPRGRSIVVPGYAWGSDRSPDGAAVAISASGRGRILVAGTAPVRRKRLIEIGERTGVRWVRWPVRDGLLAMVGYERARVLEIDPGTGKVRARHVLGGRDVAVAATPDGLAVLLAPPDGPGPATLTLLRPGAPPRDIPLPGVRAGSNAQPDLRPSDEPDLVPGLAVQDGAAFVAPTESAQILRVDLASGAVTGHALRATAAKGGAARFRVLHPVGDGRLVLTAHDQKANGSLEASWTKLVDTGDWSARTLSASTGHAVASALGIVLPDYDRRTVAFHDAAGRRLATLRPRFGISNVRLAGRHAFVQNAARRGRNHRTHVLDLATGRRVGTLPFTTLSFLLTGP